MAGYTWLFLVDPSSFLMVIVASCTILYGSYLSHHFWLNFKDTPELENNTVKTRTAIIMPIIGSIFLVLLFYFMHWIVYLLLVVMSLSSLSAVSYVAYPFVDKICTRIGGFLTKSWEVRWVGPITVSGILSFFVAVGVVTAWLVTFIWFMTDILAISLALTSLSFVRLPNMKVSLIILILFFLYDIFWVFISPFIFKKNVMVTVAMQLPTLPMVLVFPRIVAEGWSLLGLGDIVLPGLWLCFLFRFDIVSRTPFRSGYFLRSWIGYIFGLVITLVMVFLLQRGQPALLYLVPCTLLPTLFFGWRRHELKNLWLGTTGEIEHLIGDVPEDSVGLLHESADPKSV